jgi:hypothetical protein
MTASTPGFAEACSSWLSRLSHCCAPLASCFAEKPSNHYDEKMSFRVVSQQPASHAHPMTQPDAAYPGTKRKPDSRKRKGFGWPDFSARKRFGSDASRRPLISAPSDFRHVLSSSFRFPAAPEPQLQPAHVQPWTPYDAPDPDYNMFRPLELSIHSSEYHMSPMLPHFEFPARPVATPPPAYLPDGPDVERELMHQRSFASSLSFHVPRKQLPDSSSSSSSSPFSSAVPEDTDVPPEIPPRAPGRARAHTSPDMDRIKERVASAMLEMERLQRQIDDVMERQSIYAGSRPSTAHSMARTVPELEPMPSLPALPPAAPSFSERLNQDIDRPLTAPRRLTEATASPRVLPAAVQSETPLSPPLPLVLRPPLRKKKSFSRVSSWLFPNAEQDSASRFHSVTTLPRPVKGHEGFYQCVDSRPRRLSCDSRTTVSTWYTNDDDDLASPPTACSPESTPVTKQQEDPFLERAATFGKSGGRSSRPGLAGAF